MSLKAHQRFHAASEETSVHNPHRTVVGRIVAWYLSLPYLTNKRLVVEGYILSDVTSPPELHQLIIQLHQCSDSTGGGIHPAAQGRPITNLPVESETKKTLSSSYHLLITNNYLSFSVLSLLIEAMALVRNANVTRPNRPEHTYSTFCVTRTSNKECTSYRGKLRVSGAKKQPNKRNNF